MQENYHAKIKIKNPQSGIIFLELFSIFLFVLFMLPFVLVFINSAKTSREIIFNAVPYRQIGLSYLKILVLFLQTQLLIILALLLIALLLLSFR